VVVVARGILGLAWPILIGQLAVMAFAFIDTLLTGHATPADLAAMGIGASVYASIFVSLTGVLNALTPIIGQHFGARRHTAVGASFVQGLWLALLLSAFGMPLLAFPRLWLGLVNPPADVLEIVAAYLRTLSLALPAALLFRALYALSTAVSRPKFVMGLQLGGLVLKLALSELLIFGELGLPRLGAVGAAVASLVAFWAMFSAGLFVVSRHASYRGFHIRLAWPSWPHVKEQLHLGIPMGFASGLENTSFTLMTLFIAQFGTSVLGGHQIVSNLTALAYQLPLAVSIATAALTAQALGAHDPRRARATAFTGVATCVGLATLTAVSVWTLRESVVGLYTTDAAVAAVALSLIGYFAGLHVFDALQGATAAVLRAYRVAIVPMVIYALALWGPGLIGGYLVAFRPVLGEPRGVQGMWLMLLLALGLTATSLVAFYAWFLRRSVVDLADQNRGAAGGEVLEIVGGRAGLG
jgi:MATE family multidrug resistance protein